MNLDRAMERAHAVSTDLQARRLYNDIEAELSLGEPSSEQADAGEEALGVLRDRFGLDVEERARDMDDYAPSLSRTANANVAGGGSGGASSRTGTGRSGAGGGSGGGGSSPSRSRQGRSSGRPAGRRSRPTSGVSGRRVVERAAGFTGEDVTGAIIKGLRLLLGAGLAYMVLAPNKAGKYPGADAFAGVLSGVQKGIDAIVKPVDPFTALSSQPSAPAPIPGSPAGPPLTTPVYNATFNLGFNEGFTGIARNTAAGTGYNAGYTAGMVARTKSKNATAPPGTHVRAPSNPLAAFGGI